MKTNSTLKRMMIFIDETDRWKSKQLCTALVEKLRDEGCPGATVFQGCMGYGSHKELHTTALLALTTNLPQVVIAMDEPERIDRIKPLLEEMISEGLIIVDEVEATKISQNS